MSKIENIIKENYQDADILIDLIRKYDFEYFLNGTFKEFEIAINDSDRDKIKRLCTLSLVKINENLKGINSEEKEKLEYLLSDIFQPLIHDKNIPLTINDIQETLIEACKNAGYDYNALQSFLNLKKRVILKAKLPVIKSYPYYIWNGLDYELNDLIQSLKDKKIIGKVKNFRKIFKPIVEHFQYEGNKEKIFDLIVIFDILKEKKLIQPKIVSGHFVPLEKYGVDNDREFLFKKAPNRIHEYYKRSKVMYQKNRERYESMIHAIAFKSLVSMSGQ